MSDDEKEVIRKQAQDGMDSLIDPLLESTKELIRILKSRQTKRAADGATWDSLGAGNDDNEPNQAYGLMNSPAANANRWADSLKETKKCITVDVIVAVLFFISIR